MSASQLQIRSLTHAKTETPRNPTGRIHLSRKSYTTPFCLLLCCRRKMPTLTKLYSMEEAAKHNTQDNCWVVINGKIYDVSSYIDEHPGGDFVLLAAAGKDATDEFEDAGHSKTARELMEKYFVGELDETSSVPEKTAFKICKEEQPKQENQYVQKIMDITKQFWAVPVSIVSVSVVLGVLISLKN